MGHSVKNLHSLDILEILACIPVSVGYWELYSPKKITDRPEGVGKTKMENLCTHFHFLTCMWFQKFHTKDGTYCMQNEQYCGIFLRWINCRNYVLATNCSLVSPAQRSRDIPRFSNLVMFAWLGSNRSRNESKCAHINLVFDRIGYINITQYNLSMHCKHI